MRVSMSATGSVILIRLVSCALPACLGHTGYLAAHGDLTQLVPRETELAIRAAAAPGERTAVADADRRRVPRQLLELQPRLVAVFLRRFRIVCSRHQLGALLR